jgi:hypothetical protein
MTDTDLLRQLFISGLLSTKKNSDEKDFKGWISSGKYMLRKLDKTSATLYVNNKTAFISMLAYDSSRMASASFESMQAIKIHTDLPKSYAWMAIKSYYAAFFAAHSILRSFGYVASQLERGHTKLLSDYAKSLSLTFPPQNDSGFFCGQLDKNTYELALKKMNNTHEDTWALFTECLKKIRADVMSLNSIQTKQQSMFVQLDVMIDLLTNNGSSSRGNFLSLFRNNINYRHEYHAWYPYGKNSLQGDEIYAVINQWSKEKILFPNAWKKSREVYNFFCLCTLIVNMCYSVVKEIDSNSEFTSNIFAQWPQKLLKTLKTT